MSTTMADGARERLVAQIGEALFGQPGLTLMELAEKVKGDDGCPMVLVSQEFKSQADYDAEISSAIANLLRLNNLGLAGSAPEMVEKLLILAAQPSPAGQVGISAEWVLGYLATDAPEESRKAIRNAFAEYAALSAARQPAPVLGDVAQPSPASQGDELPALPYPNYPISKTGLQNNLYTASQMQDYARAALAARQPVGQEPVALGETDPIPCAWSDDDASSLVTLRDALRRIIAGTTTKDAAHFLKQPGQRRMTIKDAQEVAAAHLPYVESLVHRSQGYAAPPAQAVDLGQFRSLARSWIVEAGGTVADTKHACADELLTLIDSQAVGNG